MIRLVIIEDEELIRLGITTAINQQPDMQMVGIARTGHQGIKLVEELAPDVVLVDIGLPDISGVEVIKQIKANTSNIKIVVLSSYYAQSIVQSALNVGADSYILKKNNVPLILESIKTTFYDCKSFLDPDISRHNFFFQQKIKGKTYQDHLSNTEMQIISLMAAGFSNKHIAEQLFITQSTVKGHINKIFAKLDVADRVNALIVASKLGYIEQDYLKVS
ncbi:response regulator (plasmid) [Anabaena sp. FACHB-709]|uniref:Two-component response regulator n=3 Tax=Nostocaceae TaxID=1162 RepID=A0A1Z4KUN4_ANAVA|nr:MULTISPECIES: response regulator transcription factor [Nostocaceae]BAY72603.1 two-component response regulator [Trichormus variabilis NIES-23]MBD2174191.1 response regulator transcription factor [Anabaena cylindrica FACHB-318]MBD2275487.1 response regulator transcription factor [Nostoc sp. PCC 7120 = FACHB-418]MBD2286313.1 response regulator transcription factor [Anabaena cylindrica FACHB-170]MBD2352872.1 response regulator transcription factor [Trichormus variabilis FACHB-171]